MMKAAGPTAFLAIGLLMGCSPMTVQHDYDPDVDFSDFRSFTWMPLTSEETGAKSTFTGPFVEKRIKKSVLEVMSGKGYERDDDTPDFLVAYHLNYKRKSRVDVHGYGYWGPGAVDVHRYREGTLIIDFVDPKTKELIWRGWSIAPIQSGSDPREEQDMIGLAVREILERYPPY